VKIWSIRHKGLRRLIVDDDPAGLPRASVAKIAAIVSFLQDASGIDALMTVRSWRVHRLAGDRKGFWSLSVTRNWRITFRVGEESEIVDLDFEDYH
jgi:toxin HigB-1